MSNPLRVLLVEDNPLDVQLILHQLREAGFEPDVRTALTEKEYLRHLGPDLDVILCDHTLPQFDSIRALDLRREHGVTAPLLIVSGSIGEETAVALIRHGAADYLMKDRLGRLGPAVTHAMEQRRLEEARRQAVDGLKESEERYRDLFENANDVIFTHDLSGIITSVNRAGEVLSGYSRDELIGTSASRFLPEDQMEAAAAAMARLVSEEHVSLEVDFATRDGHRRTMEISAKLVHEDGSPARVQGIARDVTERKRAEERIAFLVYHDKLTGLPGRAMFEELLGLALARASGTDAAVAVLYVDLDGFKLVNGSLGHARGDELLRQVAVRLRGVARETDLVARLGADEFLLLLAGLDAEETPGPGRVWPGGGALVAASVASRVNEAFREPFVVEGSEIYVTASIGVALQSADAADPPTLIRHANAAMYQSKRAGPGGFVVFSAESVRPFAELSFATRLRKAVELERWTLHYQPIVDLMTGEVVASEALIRWRGPGGKLISPNEFIPLAEEMGLIEAIGEWVVDEVCRQHQAWRREGLDLDVSMNLSPRQFWQPDLAGRILSALATGGMDPAHLVVEVTETAATADVPRTQRILWDLHRHGIRVAIDDFGTGSSSLSRLKDLPVDILKIDRSFVMGLPGERASESMTAAVIELARGLGMVSLAEGIETAEQRGFLTERGCVLGQGFHFSRPVTAREFAARFARRPRTEPRVAPIVRKLRRAASDR